MIKMPGAQLGYASALRAYGEEFVMSGKAITPEPATS